MFPDNFSLVFRTVTTTDVSAVVTWMNSAYRDDFVRRCWPTETDFFGSGHTDAKQVRVLLTQTGSLTQLAVYQVRLLASCHMEKSDQHWQCRYWSMKVIAKRKELITWYERRGYCRTGCYQPFSYNDAGIGLCEELRFELLHKDLLP